MNVEYNHVGSCGTVSCGNYGVEFTVASLDGVIGFAVCGVCGVDFRDRCREI